VLACAREPDASRSRCFMRLRTTIEYETTAAALFMRSLIRD
jgi:hypothetical protein